MPGASQAALPQPREETATRGCPGVQNTIPPQPQKPTHPHQARWKEAPHPTRNAPPKGRDHQYCFLTRLQVETTRAWGQLGEILLPGCSPGRFRQKWSGMWTGNQVAEKLSQITNIMCSPFQNHRPRPKPSCLLVTGRPSPAHPRGQHSSQGWMAVLPSALGFPLQGHLSAACRAQRHCEVSRSWGKPRPEVSAFSAETWVSDFLRPGSPCALRRDNENKAGDPAPIVLRLGR